MICAIGKERYCADGRINRMESFYIRPLTLRIYMVKTIESVSDEMRFVITARAKFSSQILECGACVWPFSLIVHTSHSFFLAIFINC